VTYPYNMKQQDALFSTCFEQSCCLSSGGSSLLQTATGIVMRYVDWLFAGSIPIFPTASQNNAWLYQLLFIQSWSSWWWAARLLETCTSRGLL